MFELEEKQYGRFVENISYIDFTNRKKCITMCSAKSCIQADEKAQEESK